MDKNSYTYILRALVHPAWGEMQVAITLRATSWFDAQAMALAELKQWKRSQESMRRGDFPWLDEAIACVERMRGPDFFFGFSSADRVDINWYDEREPFDKAIVPEA